MKEKVGLPRLSNLASKGARLFVAGAIVGTLSIKLAPEPPLKGFNILLKNDTNVELITNEDYLPFYELPSKDPKDYMHAEAVEKAIQFILSLQDPKTGAIRTSPGSDDVSPMDMSHSIMALNKTRYVKEAKMANDFIFKTQLDYPEETEKLYDGAWHDHLTTDGNAKENTTTGRMEQDAIAVAATYTTDLEDPDYLSGIVDGKERIERVERGLSYITKPEIENQNGAFSHSPDYGRIFGEENARAKKALELGLKMIVKHKGLDVLDHRSDIKSLKERYEKLCKFWGKTMFDIGMPFDLMKGMWESGDYIRARRELSELIRRNFLNEWGVSGYDWQSEINPDPVERFKYSLYNYATAPSQTLDAVILLIQARYKEEAKSIMDYYAEKQGEDGGWAGVEVFGFDNFLGKRFGEPTIFTASRFILSDLYLTDYYSKEKIEVVKNIQNLPIKQEDGSRKKERNLRENEVVMALPSRDKVFRSRSVFEKIV